MEGVEGEEDQQDEEGNHAGAFEEVGAQPDPFGEGREDLLVALGLEEPVAGDHPEFADRLGQEGDLPVEGAREIDKLCRDEELSPDHFVTESQCENG